MIVTPIDEIVPTEPPDGWNLLPEFVPYKPELANVPGIKSMRQGDKVRIWPPNGVGYIYRHIGGRYDGRITQVVVSVLDDNTLHATVSDSSLGLSKDEAAELIAKILPDHSMNYIPQEKINKDFIKGGVKKRVLIGSGRALIQHFEKQL